MIKILHLGKYYPPHKGGIEKTTKDIVDEVNNHGFYCDVLALLEKGDKELNAFENYTVHYAETNIKAFSGAFSISYIFKYLKIYKNYDIIHVHLPNPLALLAVLIGRKKLKIILHWHSDILNKPFLYLFIKPLEKFALRKANKILVTSRNYIEFSAPLSKFKYKCFELNSCCEKLPFIDNEYLRSKYKIKQDIKIVFSLGRLVDYKGFEYLIKSAKFLDENYLVYIGGSGPLQKALTDLIDNMHLNSKVILLGELNDNDLVDYYNLCDVFCLPSIYKSEAFGLVQCEAFSLSKPVISTNIIGSGVPWVNLNGVTGIVVPPMDSNAISEAILEICNNKELYNQMSFNAQKRYDELFRKDIMIEKLISYYESIKGEH